MTAGDDDASRSVLERSELEREAEPVDGARVSLPSLRLRAGGELGRGGMGVVTAAFDPVLERTVALKRPLGEDALSEARLLREAKLAAQLDHPAIVGVLDVGRDEEGRLAAVLPVRAGRSLGEAVASSTPPSPELLRALLVASQAVAFAHARGVVHRDLSPSNVRLGEEGAVWVIDWGLAATRDEAARGGFKGGTSGYAAPEQRAGAPLDERADVWSLGALLHLVCTGTAPTQDAARPSSVPAPLWAIARKATEVEPTARYRDAHAFAAELARWLDGQPVEAWPEGPLARLARRARRSPRVAAGLALGLVLVTLAAVLTANAQQRARRATAALLIDSSERALKEDDVRSARQLANEALAVVDSPRARGVLAATARVSEVKAVALPPEDCVVVDAFGGTRLCLEQGKIVALDAEQGALLTEGRTLAVSRARNVVELRGPDGVMASVPLTGGVPGLRVSSDRRTGVVAVPDGVVVLARTRQGAPGPGPMPIARPARGTPVESLRVVTPCTPGQPVRFAVPWAGQIDVLCGDAVLVQLDEAGDVLSRRSVLGLSTLLRGAHTGDVLDDETLAVANAQGQLGLVSRSRAEVMRVSPSALGLVHTTVAALDGRSVLFVGERGAGLWRVPEGHLLPVNVEDAEDARADEQGFVVRRGELRRRLSWTPTLSLATNLHGRAALALHEPTRRLAVGDAFGGVELFSLETGSLARIPGAPRVIKSLAFSPSGRWLALGAAGADGVLVFDTREVTPKSTPGPWVGRPELRGRHVVFLGEDLLVVYGWAAPPWAVRWNEREGAWREESLPSIPSDVRSVVGGEARAWSLDTTGAWTQLTAGACPSGEAPCEAAVATEVTRWTPAPQLATSRSDGTGVVTATGTRVERRDSARGFDAAAPVEALALAKDGRLGVCRRDGVVELRDAVNELVLEVSAFEGRCGRIAFCDGERALCAVGWDGRLRVVGAR